MKLFIFSLIATLIVSCGGSGGGGGAGSPGPGPISGADLEGIKRELESASKTYFRNPQITNYENSLIREEIYLLHQDSGFFGNITNPQSKVLRVAFVNDTDNIVRINFEDFFPQTGLSVLTGGEKNCDAVDTRVGLDNLYDFPARDYCIIYFEYSPPASSNNLTFLGTAKMKLNNIDYEAFINLSNGN